MSGTSDPKPRHRLAPRRSLRTQLITPIVAPVIALTGLWGYTAVDLTGEQTQLRNDAERIGTTGGRALNVVSHLQSERRLTALWQSTRSDAARAALDGARTRTDAAVAEFRATMPSVDAALSGTAHTFEASLDTLATRRQAVDTRTVSPDEAFGDLTGVIESGTNLISSAVRSEDGPLARGGSSTAALVRLVEMLSREDALLTAAVPKGGLPTATHHRFVQYLSVQRDLRASLSAEDLPEGARGRYAALSATPQASSVTAVEDAVVVAPDTRLPAATKAWNADAEVLLTGLRELAAGSLDELSDTASDRATGLLVGLIAGTVLTGALLAAGAVLGLRTRRSTLKGLAELQSRTEEMARQWPEAVARSEKGEPFVPFPPSHHLRTAGELELLGAAVERLRLTAADTVLSQSRGHAGVEKVLGQLTRRTQTLIHRLIALLDDLERKHGDSDLLKDIFKVDHLATRVRRHAENLVILGDTPPSRRMTEPVTITDVMRSAVAETEHYTRVKVENLPPTKRLALAGRAVADVTHLLAELVENATNFSPPYTQVVVSAVPVAEGVVLHVEDHGLGIPAEQLVRSNQLLAHPQKPDMAALGADPRLGHFVVARLAQRHQIRVELRPSVYGGTLAIVFVPARMLEELGSPVMDQLRAAAAQASAGTLAADPTPQHQVTPSYESVTSELSDPAPHTRPSGHGSDALPGAGGAPGSHADHGAVISGQVVGGPGVGDQVAGGRTAGGQGLGGQGGEGVPAPEQWDTHSRVPDLSGFPTYGGAGLVSPEPGAPAPLDGQPHRAAAVHEPPHAAPAPPRAPEPPRAAPATTPAPAPRRAPGAPHAPAPAAPGGGQAKGPGETPRLRQPEMLPQRTRGSSLAVQLRRENEEASSGIDGVGGGSRSPEASARIVAAIRRGMDQATGTHAVPDTDGRQSE
ncbi:MULTISPECIES: nitrate- and nitrite sensing domain-containing protein [unclassified Streptomyces]|uniref:sensor histidine kinase n=1 Tax=unclassified Streptomyces TaxID=2593676 RepID=UPI0037F99126